VKRLVLLPREPADLSREFSYSFLLRDFIDPAEASGQLLFDGVVWRFESAQSQFRCQIVHRYFTGSIFASKPVPDCADPACAQLPNVENNKAPPTSQIVAPLLYAPALEECRDIRFSATFALVIHLARLCSFSKLRPHRIVPCLAAATNNGVVPYWIENPQGKMDVPNGNWAHLTGRCGAIGTQA
jgi:hypothetical protein